MATRTDRVLVAAQRLTECPSLTRYAELKRAVDALMQAAAHLECVGPVCEQADAAPDSMWPGGKP